MSRINMVVVRLPIDIQDELDRKMITTMEKLFTELGRLEDSVRIRKRRLGLLQVQI